ncbi:MAG TPA: maltose alpha-D-glucosyltransferase [Thermoanaerobaculia bacterium]|nr:maltose alpha-D-glucosyltransferase [Thermoanaerobaculia bacterium]
MARRRTDSAPLDDDPLWYKDAIIYQLHVRAYQDSNADGIGDFQGLTEKLDYLQDLGVTAVWTLPFYPSPLKDDGYDIARYTEVNPSYGELRDFRAFLKEAHRRGIRVITELVINHTSDQHEWFQRSRRAKPGTAWRDYYVWSDTPDRYRDARIIFKDFETSNWSWDPVADAYFWHRFYHHQPDLNFGNPAVHRALFRVLDFWLEMGVDGLRLDAIPYLYEREGTTCENLPETHEFLKKFRAHVDRKFSNRMLLAEANQWPEDSLPYFGDGDECHMAFHFPLMPRIFMSVAMEDRFPIIDILNQTPDGPPGAQWALFLRNHDELTLEMVTDEDRDYMWRTYAQDAQARINLGIRRRLAPLLGSHRRKIELLNGLLFSFPGTPIIYYGDEIGMGDNIYLGDRNGVRTPMQWSSDKNAGFSRANPQKLFLPVIIDPEYHYEAVNVEAQQNNPHSLLWWMKRLIALRKRHKAFGRGTLEFLHPENRRVLAFLRRHEDETILVVANLSRFVQAVELDLAAYLGTTPVEMFGYSAFPQVTEKPYFLTLGPHSFFWFTLEGQPRSEIAISTPHDLPEIAVESLVEALSGRARSKLESILGSYLKERRWYAGKSKTIKSVSITDAIPVDDKGVMLMLHVGYREGDNENYVLPITSRRAAEFDLSREENRIAAIARFRGTREELVVFDAMYDRGFDRLLVEAIGRRRQFDGDEGELRGIATKTFRKLRGTGELEPHVSKAEQSNTSVSYGDRFFLKLYRRVEAGINPDFEISRFLSEKTTFRATPPLAGGLEYHRGKEVSTVALLQGFVPSGGDAWSFTLDTLGLYFERLLSERELLTQVDAAVPEESFVDLARQELPPLAADLLGAYVSSAGLLARRTAELHLALASRPEDPVFAPEPFTPHYQRSIYQHMRTQMTRTFQVLRKRARELQEPARTEAQTLLAREQELHERFREVLERKISTLRIRTHGDYHLGQVLHTGKDFIIIDFEGEPARPLSERRIKRSALRDVAGMLRSFNYAPYAVLLGQVSGLVRDEDAPLLDRAARFWHRWISAVFLERYLEVARADSIAPKSDEELDVLLRAYLLEKALYEVGYEMNNRPDWVRVPLRGILQLLDEES